MIWIVVLTTLWALSDQTAALRSAEAMLNESGIDWSTLAEPGLNLHVQRGSPAEEALAALRSDARLATRDVLGLLGETAGPPVDLFYIDSLDSMERLVGARPKALSVPESYYGLFVFNDQVRARHRHELAHVLAGHFWGSAARPARWINEGLAAFAEGTCAGYSLDALAVQFRDREASRPFAELVHGFGTAAPLEANVRTGSFVGYLIREYGVDRFQALWRHGLGRFAALYERPFEDAVRDWETLLGEPAADVPDLAVVEKEGCG